MTRLVRELDDLVFDRRAIPRTDAFNLPAVERRTRNRFPQNPLRFLRGVADVALDLRPLDLAPSGTKTASDPHRPAAARTWHQSMRAAVQPRRRAGFQPRPVQTQASAVDRPAVATEPRHCGRSCTASRPTWAKPFRNVPVVTITAPALDRPAVAQRHARRTAPVRPRLSAATSACLMRRFGSRSSTSRMRTRYMLLIHLRARRPNRRTAAGIQQPELDPDGVRHFAHHPAQRVDLAHQVPFGDAADGGIAGHLRDQVQVHGDHGGAQPHARARPRGFASRVAGSDHHHVVPLVHCYHCIGNENSDHRRRRPGARAGVEAGASRREWRSLRRPAIRASRKSATCLPRRWLARLSGLAEEIDAGPDGGRTGSAAGGRRRRCVPRARPRDRRARPRQPRGSKAARYLQRTFCSKVTSPPPRFVTVENPDRGPPRARPLRLSGGAQSRRPGGRQGRDHRARSRRGRSGARHA